MLASLCGSASSDPIIVTMVPEESPCIAGGGATVRVGRDTKL